MYTISVRHVLLRVIADGPDAKEKVLQAVANTPSARWAYVEGPLPSNVERYAAQFKSRYLEAQADEFLAAEGEPTKNERLPMRDAS